MPTGKKNPGPSLPELMRDWHDEETDLLLETVIAGCTLIAYADGRVAPEEHDRMLGLIRRFEPLRTYRMDDFVQAFEEATRRFEADPETAERDAYTAIGRLRGRRKESETLVRICCAIASADGGFDASEQAVAIRMCTTLGLDAAVFELVDTH